MGFWNQRIRSKYLGFYCRSPRDGCEMVGWLALTVSTEFGCQFGIAGRWLGDDWENTTCCFRTPNTNQNINTTHNHMAGWLALDISKTTGVNQNRRELAGRWLGGCPWLFPKIEGLILDRGKMAGRLLGGWHRRGPTISVVIVNRQEMAGRWPGGRP